MTKLRIHLFAISFLLFQLVVNGQARFGILAGPHSASIFESNTLPGWSDNVKPYYSSRFSFHGGVVGDIPFSSKSPLFFQPGLVYSAKGRKFSEPSAADLSAIENQNVKFTHQQQYLSYIDIPLNLVLKYAIGKDSRFIFGGGPQPSFLLGVKDPTIVPGGPKDTGTYKKLDFSLNALMG
ncbi:MAG: outer membrane beta-barrel protein, partial [Bacteroidota bacterium]